VTLPVIVLGSGGHAKVLVEALRAQGTKVIGVTDADPARRGAAVLGADVIGTDEALHGFPPSAAMLVNGLGSVGATTSRRKLFERFKGRGYRFATVVHPTAWVSPSARLGEGVQIMAGCVVQADCAIGDDSIVNSGASVDHDCRIGSHVHIAPGVTLSGGVEVGDNAHIGTASTVMQGVRVGESSIVGAGAVVIKNVPPRVTVGGVPARRLRS
jgi:UDP-perosamine 4-acetyltransferase